MEFKLTEDIRAQLGTARECMVIAEAEHLLAGTLLEARLEGEERSCFVKDLDVTLWEFRLGELLADGMRPEYRWEGRGRNLKTEVKMLLSLEKQLKNKLSLLDHGKEKAQLKITADATTGKREKKEAELAAHLTTSWN